MGKAFRSPSARAEDVDVLTSADCDDLDADESITYFKRLPHRAAVRLADEGTMPTLDASGRKVARIDIRAGTLQQIKLEEGIVTWTLRDEAGRPVRWERAKAAELVDGLSDKVRAALLDRIGEDKSVPDLDDEVTDPDTGLVDTVGNA